MKNSMMDPKEKITILGVSKVSNAGTCMACNAPGWNEDGVSANGLFLVGEISISGMAPRLCRRCWKYFGNLIDDLVQKLPDCEEDVYIFLDDDGNIKNDLKPKKEARTTLSGRRR